MEKPTKPLYHDDALSDSDIHITVRLETLHLSTFAVTCSLFWVCRVISESEETTPETVVNDNDYYCITFLVDWRDRPELAIPIPATYFGNCLTSCVAALPKKKLVGENGVCEAVNAIGSQVRGLKGQPLKGVEGFKSACSSGDLGEWSKRLFHVAGSLKLNAYKTDFVWGKPKLSEVLHADDLRTMCLSDCRDQDGGIEVGLVLKGTQMKKFSTTLEQQLRDIGGS